MRAIRVPVFVLVATALFNTVEARQRTGGVNPPVARSQAFSVTRGGTLNVPSPGIAQSKVLTAALVGSPTNGSVTLQPNGAFVYVHNGSATTTDSFTFTLDSGHATSNLATVRIEVVGTVATPLANADSYSVERGKSLSIPATAILRNDADAQANQLFASVSTGPAHGVLGVFGDGGFVYTHDGSSATTDTFTYRATNGVMRSAPATVTFNITPANAAPVAVADALTVARGGILTLAAPGLMTNDTDTENSPLTASIVVGALHGNAFIDPDGSLLYEHDGSATTTDTFRYRISDGQAQSAPVTVTVTVRNTPPIANGDAFAVSRGGTLLVPAPGLSANDFDLDGDALAAALVAGPGHGTVTVTAGGGFTYTHDNGTSATDSFTYRVNDGLSDSNIATVAISIVSTPQPVVANADAYDVLRGATLNVASPGVLANDSDPQGNPLVSTLVTAPAHGTLTLNANGSFSYHHNGDTATSDTFRYAASNGFGTSVQANVQLTIRTTNAPPTANSDVYSVTRGQILTINPPGILGNDSDPEGASLTPRVLSGPFHGVLTAGGDGSFVYVNDGSVATSDSFSYVVSDGVVDSAPATVTFAVHAPAAPPVASADHYSVVRAGTLTVSAPGVLANDTDPSAAPLAVVLLSTTAHGSLTINANGSFEYQNDGSTAATDTFTYAATNGSTQSAPATVTIDITATAVTPSAANDSYSVARSGRLDVPAPGVLANDSANVSGVSLSAAAVTPPAHGTLALGPDGAFVYQNDGNAATTDSFTYRASNGQANSTTATASIAITAANQTPIASNDSFTVAQGGTLTVLTPGVLTNDSDPEGSALNATQVAAPQHGALTLNANGSFVYTHDGSSTTSDSFSYRANDGQADSNTANAAITVTLVNHPPVATDDSFTTPRNTPLVVAAPGVLSNDTDSDGNTLTAVVVAPPAHGAVTLATNGGFTFTPATGFSGADSFTYKANDGTTDSNTATVTLAITAPSNTAPVALADSFTVREDQTLNSILSPPFTVLANDTDADGNPLTAALATPPAAAQGTVTLNPDGTFIFTPALNFFGTATFTYTANDAASSSAPATVTITVVSRNDVPSFTKGPDVTRLEDSGAQVIAGWATAISTGPANESSETPHFNVVSNTNAALFAVPPAISNAGALTFTPAANANGSATITINIQDDGGTANGGVDTSANQAFVINITSVNDVPSFTKGADQTVNEDAAAQTIAGWATAISTGPADESAQAADFIVTNDNNALFSAQPAVSPAGVLTYTPAANANGTATVTVRIHDDGGTASGGVDTSNAQTFTITVNGVNDAPVNTVPGGQTTLEDIPIVFSAANSNAISIADIDAGTNAVQVSLTATNGILTLSSTTGLTFSAGSNGSASFTASSSLTNLNAALNGLTFTPTADFNGAASINLITSDLGNTGSGGTLTDTDSIAITITAVNDAPSFTKGADDSVAEDSGARNVPGWATAIAAGPADESAQTLTFSVTNNTNTALFSVPPAVSAAGVLTYTPAANANGSATITLTLSDNGGTANGGVNTSAAQTFVINVTAVNDAPANTVPGPQVTAEDTALVFSTGNGNSISVADIDATTVSVALSATGGTLTLSGTTGLTFTAGANGTSAMTVSGLVTAINTALNGLSFAPALNSNGPALLTITTSDLGNTGTGGPLTDTDTVAITVTAVNDAPVNTVPGPQTTNEDTALVFSSANANALSVGDVDATSAQVSLSVTSGTVTLGGTTGLTFSAGANGSSAMTFSGTIVNINAALSGTSFMPVLNSTAPVTLTIVTNDQGNSGTGGALSDTDTVAISITAVNDAPVNTVPGAQVTAEDTTLVFSTGNGNLLSVSDVDGSNASVQLSVTNGALTLANTTGLTFSAGANATSTMTFSGANTDINTALNGLSYLPGLNFNGPDTLTIVTNDLGNTGLGGALSDTDTVSITVTAVNDAPGNTVPGAQATSEDTALVFSTGNSNLISVSDVDGSTAQVAISVTSGTLTLSGTTGLTFNAGANGTSSMTLTGTLTNLNAALSGLSFLPALNSTAPVTFTIVTNDLGNTGTGGALSDTDTVAITVNAVNDAPVNTVPGPQVMAEDATLVFSTGNGNAISIADLDAGTSAVQVALTATNGTLTLSGTAGLTFTAGANSSASMTFSGTITNINAALAGMSFAPTLNFNGGASLQIVTNDQGNSGTGGALTDTDSVSITITAVNDAPINTVPGPQATNEDTALVFSTGNGNLMSISDVDGSTAQVALSVTSGTLTLSGTTGLTFSAGASGTSSMTFSGTHAAINTALNGLSYQPALNATAAVTLTMQTDDLGNTGAGGALTDTDTVAISITAVNDAPVNSVPGPQTTNEDTPLAFTSVSVSDVDATTAQVTLSVTNGTLALSGTTGLTFSGGANNSSTMTFSGSLTNINLALNGMSYTPALNYFGPAALTLTTNDLGSTGAGGALSDTDTVAITVTAVNDAPVANNDSFATNEDTTLNATVPGVLVNDTDVEGNSLTASVVTSTTNGTLTLFSNGSFNYTPNANFNGSDSFTYRANDGSLNSNNATVNLTVNAVNDAPVAVADTGYVVQESQTLNVVAPGVLVNDTDVDGNPLTAIKVADAACEQFGAVTLNANGSFTYVHGGNTIATSDCFKYKANDGTADSNVVTVTINITHNQAPVAVNDGPYNVNRNGTLNVSTVITGVLNNDTDANSDPLTAIKVTDPAHGTVTLNANGTFTYVNNGAAFTSDSFTYKANDGQADSNIATVNITINNAAPSATGDSYTTVGNTRLNVGPASGNLEVVVSGSLVANDTDANGDTLTVKTVTGSGGPVAISGATNITTTHGSVTMNPNGTFAYFPAAGNTLADSFTYIVTDGLADSSSVTVNLTVSGMVWYVRNTTAGTTGTSSDPFQLLPSAQTASSAGHYIYMYAGNGVTTPGADTGIVLKANQTLVGAGVAGPLVVGGVSITIPSGIAFPKIGNSTGPAIALANGVTVKGVAATTTSGANLAGISGTSLTTGVTIDTVRVNTTTGAGISITASPTTTSSLANIDVQNAAGVALVGTNFGTFNINGGTLSGADVIALNTGTVNMSAPFASVTSLNGANPVSLTTITGNVDAASGNLQQSSGTLFAVSGGSVSSTWSTFMQQLNNGGTIAVTGGHTGTLTFDKNISANNGSGVTFNNADGTYNFTQPGSGDSLILSGGNARISITNGSDGTFSFSANSAVGSPNGGAAFEVNGGTPVINYLGTLSQTSTAQPVVSISNVTGGNTGGIASPYSIQLGGNITYNVSSGTAISTSANTGGHFGFTGATVSLTSGTGTAVSLGGATVTFAPATSLTISTTTGTGFSASGATVNVVGSSNTITASSTASGIVLSNVTIGGGGMTFSNVVANGGANGLSLTNVSGALTISAGQMFNTTGANVLVSGGTLSLTTAADIFQQNNAAKVLSVTNHATGTLAFNGEMSSMTSGTGILFDNADGTYTFGAVSPDSAGQSGGAAGIDITNGSGGSFTFNDRVSVSNRTGANFTVVNSTASVTFSGNLTKTGGTGALLSVSEHSTGTLTFNTVSGSQLFATTGSGLSFANADGTYNFNGSAPLSGGATIDIAAGTDGTNGSQGTFSFGTAVTVASGGTTGSFVVTGSTPNVTFSGSLTQNTAGQPVVSITNQAAGTITFQTGTISGTGTGIILTNADGTVNFNGTTTLGAGSANVTIQTGSSGTFNFGSNTTIGSAVNSPSVTLFSVNGGAPNVTFDGTMQQVFAQNVVNIQNVTGGTIDFNGAITKSNTPATAIVLSANSGNTVRFDGNVSITNTGNWGAPTAVNLTNNATAVNFASLAITFSGAATGTALNATNASVGGTLTVTTGSINSLGGVALNMSNMALGNSTFTSLAANGGTHGVSLTSVTGGPLTINAGALNNHTVAGFLMTNTPINITSANTFFNGLRSIEVTNTAAANCGTKTFSGNISQAISTSSHSGILVNNCNAGTVTFSGTSKVINTTFNSNNAVTLTNNTGATINFTNGGLQLTTTTGKPFTATGGGTVSVTTGASANTITSTTGTALEVQNTTIGASGLTFRSINANGAVNGILLNTTGASGGLTVTGNSAAGTGGTVQSTTGDSIKLTNTRQVSLSFMNVQSSQESGILGDSVTDLDLTDCNFTNNGDDSADVGIKVTNLWGTSDWTNLSVTGSALANVFIDNSSGTLTNLTVSGNSHFDSLGTTFGGNSFLMDIRGTATVIEGSITGATFQNNKPARGFTLQSQDTANVGNGTNKAFVVQNGVFTNNGLQASFEQSGSANLTFQFLNNGTAGNPMTMPNTPIGTSHALNVFSSSTSTGGSIEGRLSGNYVGNAGVAGSGSAIGNGLRVFIQGKTVATLLIDGNVIRQIPQARGIDIQLVGNLTAGQPIVQHDITVTNNDVNPQDSTGFPAAAIYLAADNQGSPARLRSDIRGNTVPAGGAIDVFPTFIILDEVVAGAEAQLVDTAPASANCTAQLTSTNTGSASANAGCVLIAGPIGTPP